MTNVDCLVIIMTVTVIPLATLMFIWLVNNIMDEISAVELRKMERKKRIQELIQSDNVYKLSR